MNINWYGQSCFQVTASSGKNGLTTIIIDPFEESIGLKLPRKMEADTIKRIQPKHNIKGTSSTGPRKS